MIIALVNSKGGVGKSTIAVHLAVWLFDQGHSVALLDTDKQRSSSQWIGEAEEGIMTLTANTPDECLSCLQALAAGHDYVIADGPAGIDEISRSLLLLADLAVFPMTPSILDLRSMVQATQTLRYARVINHGRPTAKIVLNKMRLRERTSRELLAMAPQLGVDVTSSVLRDVQLYRDAAQQGSVVTRMRGSVGAAPDEMSRLCDEIQAIAPSARKRRPPPKMKEVSIG
jgi:chromosome partitioning protein